VIDTRGAGVQREFQAHKKVKVGVFRTDRVPHPCPLSRPVTIGRWLHSFRLLLGDTVVGRVRRRVLVLGRVVAAASLTNSIVRLFIYASRDNRKS
jgi:hypothetical protein